MAAEKINKTFRDGDVLHAEELNAILNKFNDNVDYINDLPTETQKGDNGSSPISCYKWFEKDAIVNAPTSKVVEPDGWSKYASSMPSDTSKTWYLWMSSNTQNGDGTITDNWSTPVRISGEDGDNGTDAKDREWIYNYTQEGYNGNTGQKSPSAAASGSDTNKNQDDWVPNSWYDRALSVSAENPDVYASWRDYDYEHETWKAFNPPINWSHWGSKGLDGDGVQYIYKLYPEEIEENNLNAFKPTKTTQNDKGEWLPVTPSPSDTNTQKSWTDDAETPTANFPYCYCSVIKQINGEWGNYGPLSLWAKYSKDGIPGSSPINCYKWETIGITPERPANNEQDPENPVGWSKYAPNKEPGKYLWMSSNIKNGNGTVTESWSIPVRISGDNGDAGSDTSKQREWIYNYSSDNYDSDCGEYSPNGQAECVDDIDWEIDDFVPSGWYDRALPVSQQNPNVYASWRDWDKENEQWENFNEPILWSHWGENGTDGDGVQYFYKSFAKELTSTQLSTYKPVKVGTAPDPITGEWNVAKAQADITEGNWTDDPETPTEEKPYCYCAIIKQINGVWEDFSNLSLWAKYSLDGSAYTLVATPASLPYNPNTNEYVGANSDGEVSIQLKAFYNGIDISSADSGILASKVAVSIRKKTTSGHYGSIVNIPLQNNVFTATVLSTDVSNTSHSEVIRYEFNLNVGGLWQNNSYSGGTTVAAFSVPVVKGGINGLPGEATTGRMFYQAGIWNSANTYTCNDKTCPVVYYTPRKKYYYLDYNGSVTGSDVPGESIKWVMVSDFSVVMVEALFADFAKLGSFIISGDFFISQYGKFYQNQQDFDHDLPSYVPQNITEYGGQPCYTYFRSADPGGTISNTSYPKFVPTKCINALTGEEWSANGKVHLSSSGSTIGGFVIEDDQLRSSNNNIKLYSDGSASLGNGTLFIGDDGTLDIRSGNNISILSVDVDGSGYIGTYKDRNNVTHRGISWNSNGVVDDFYCQGSYADITTLISQSHTTNLMTLYPNYYGQATSYSEGVILFQIKLGNNKYNVKTRSDGQGSLTLYIDSTPVPQN